jgi:hypothetical protein
MSTLIHLSRAGSATHELMTALALITVEVSLTVTPALTLNAVLIIRAIAGALTARRLLT